MISEQPGMRAWFDQRPAYYVGMPIRRVAQCQVVHCLGPVFVCHVVDRETLTHNFYCQCRECRIKPVSGLATEQEAVQALDVLLAMLK